MFKMFSTMTLLGLASISALYAQSGQPVQANVPFAFTVQDTTLLAGNYQLMYNNTAHILTVRGLDRNSGAAFVIAQRTTASERSSRSGRLVFQCYGRSCYLAQVWHGGFDGNRGLKLRPAESERKLVFATRAVSITIPVK
jgi:hypothetical protein